MAALIVNIGCPQLLKTAGLAKTRQEEFVVSYILNDKPMPEFWQGMRRQPGLGEKFVDKLQFSVQLAGITQNQLQLVKTLQSRPDIQQVRDLAKIDRNAWLQIIDQNDITIPEVVTGSSPMERKQTYVQTLIHIVEDAFPTTVLAERMRRDPEFTHDAFQRFFADNPEFNFGATKVASYLAEHEGALNGISDPAGFTKELIAMQRIFAFSPQNEKYEAIKVLWQHHLHSAHAVTRMGEIPFISTYSQQLGGEAIAKQIFDQATQVNSITIMAQGMFR